MDLLFSLPTVMKLFVAFLDLCLRGVTPFAETGSVAAANVSAAPPKKRRRLYSISSDIFISFQFDGFRLIVNQTGLGRLVPKARFHILRFGEGFLPVPIEPFLARP